MVSCSCSPVIECSVQLLVGLLGYNGDVLPSVSLDANSLEGIDGATIAGHVFQSSLGSVKRKQRRYRLASYRYVSLNNLVIAVPKMGQMS